MFTARDLLPAEMRQALREMTETYAQMCTQAGMRIVDAGEDAADSVTMFELEEPAARLQKRFLQPHGAMAKAKARMSTITPADLTPPMPALYRAFLLSSVQ